MGSISNCSRHSEDRISNLPDEIIGYILSSLPTKEAVATSILSTKLIHAWNFVTTVDLDDYNIPSFSPSLVYRVLLQHKPSCMDKFRLELTEHYQASDIKSWIDYALRCNVKHLYISADHIDEYSPLSSKIFSSATLTVLNLDAYEFIMKIPSTFCLPRLKIVRLSRVQFPNDDSFTRFVGGCPVLEELNLSYLTGTNFHVIKIVAPPLKRLVLSRVFVDRGDNDDIGSKIIINAPSLVYLEITNCCADTKVHSPMLIEANIVFDKWARTRAIEDFLKGISGIQSLALSWSSEELMMTDLVAEGHYNFPKFPKLNYLALRATHKRGFLAGLLQKSPHLESLVYREFMGGRQIYDSELEQQEKIEWQTIPTNLKFVDIKMGVGIKSCADMVSCFLTKAKSLEKLIMEIAFSKGVEQKLLKMVNYFPKNYGEVVKVETEYSFPSRFIWTLHYTSRTKLSQCNKITRK